MKRGQNEDLWKYYYENGQVSNEGHYRNSLNEGSWKAWNEDGKLIEEIIYKEGEIEEIIFAHENGKDLVVNGNGNYQYTDEEGNITSSGRVENGKNIGIWKSFYPDGSIQNEMMFEDNESKILNVFDRDGGQQVKNGNGMMRITYESGNLEEEGEVKNGKRYGTWFEYYDIPDAVSLNSNYENGMLNGMMTSYNLDQTIWIEGKLKNNIREGLWKWYFRTGGLESEVNFIAGEKDGIQKFYNESGIEVKQEIYKNGEFLEEKIINLK